MNEFFGKIVPGLFTYQRYRPDVIKAFVKKQRKAKIRGQPLQRVFLILEDMMYDKSILRTDKWLAYLFQNGRHLQATLIISSQYAMSLPPEFRSQVGGSLSLDHEVVQFATLQPRELFCLAPQLLVVRSDDAREYRVAILLDQFQLFQAAERCIDGTHFAVTLDRVAHIF